MMQNTETVIDDYQPNILDIDAVEELQNELLLLLEDEHEYTRLNRLEFFDPYPFQVGFLNSHASEIALRAANQIGKTLSGTAWDAMDLTGKYPDWYTGVKYGRPVNIVVGCVNNDKTRDILQKELFGDPIEWEEELGTGWIPLECIGKIQKKRGVPDAFYHVRIKHYTNGIFDGWSKVTFLAYEMGKSTWMAHKADITHLDEECPMDILEQAARSGIATGGRIRMTFTPENGVTDVVKLVENDYELHTAEWSDVAGTTFTFLTKDGKEYPFKAVKTLINGNPGHLTEDKIRAAAKKIPVHSLDMRMRGIPVLGSGLVFRFTEEEFKKEAYEFPDHFKFIDAMDFGGISSTAHPTAYARLFYDPTNDKIGVYDGFKLQGKEIPEIAAHIVMKPNTDIVPVVYPHDGNKMVTADETTRNQYQSAGVNMYTNEDNPDKSHATNPPKETQKEGDGGNKIMPGINEMSLRMNDGRFIVFDTVYEFWEEYRKYHMKDGKIVDIDDDFIAAVRYGVMMIRHAVTLERTKVVFNSKSRRSGSGWMSS